MSIIQLLSGGGMANISGDISESERNITNELVREFDHYVRKTALALQMPASILSIQQSNFLAVVKDISNYHFVFAMRPGDNQITYRNFAQEGRVELGSIVHSVTLEIGDVSWAFSIALCVNKEEKTKAVEKLAKEYVQTVLTTQNNPNQKVTEQALSQPEIASGIQKFKQDFRPGTKTAFVIMQFGSNVLRTKIFECIKTTLAGHDIVALRADSKEYMDDLFANIKVYLHSCDFGISVFDRITEDDFNPNVTLEVGFMFGLGKDVLLLKDQTLKTLSTDLTGKLYKEFDINNIGTTLPKHIEKWLGDKGYLES